MNVDNVDIVIQNNRAFFNGWYPRDLVDDALSAEVPGARFSPAFRAKKWDGKTHLLSRVSNTFPPGVLHIVKDLILSNGFTISVTNKDIEVLKELVPDEVAALWDIGFPMVESLGPFTFRDYQIEAGNAFLTPCSEAPYRGILHMGTGSGKTLTSAGIVATLNRHGKVPTLFLVHGKSLVKQTYDVYVKCFGEDLVGTCNADDWNPKLITIASVDTIASRLKKEKKHGEANELLDEVQFIIADECHRATSKGWVDIFKASAAPFRLGLSGTPIKKEDDRDLLLQSVTGPIVYHLETSKLQEGGHVAEAELLTVAITRPELKSLDWHDAYMALIVENTERTKIIADLAIRRANDHKTVLILAGNSVKFAHNIYEEIERRNVAGSAGVQFKIVTGTTKSDVVNEAFQLLREKKLDILITTLLADEGVDVPAINTLMTVGGGKSYVKVIQRVGRGLRIKEDNSSLEVIDFFDMTNKYLIKHAKERLKFYKEENIFKAGTTIADVDYEFLEVV
jgi:superfamily II DNA or RNA helicase